MSRNMTTDRQRSIRLGIDMIGGGILLVGICFAWIYPNQSQIGALVQAMAAVLVGSAALIRGVRGMLQGRVDQSTDQLVSIAVLAAAASGDFVTAVSLPLLLDVVRIFEERTVLGAKEAIQSLLELSTPPLIRIIDGAEHPCTAEELSVGDVLLIRPGMRVGADAEVVEGWSLVDTSTVTGETQAQTVQVGTKVYAGTQNISAEIRVRVDALGRDSAIGRVIAILEEAMETPQIQAIERWIGVYVPIALCAAGTVLFFTEDLSRSIALLVALCPTALAIAGPSTMVCALNTAAREGILIKSRTALSTLHECRVLAIDKTGTLTKGELSLQRYSCSEELLALAARCAQVSLHPISRALVQHAHTHELPLAPIQGEEQRGEGVVAHIDGVSFFLGRASWLEQQGIEIPTEYLEEEGSVVFFGSESSFLGAFFFGDVIRTEAKETLDALRSQGFSEIVMLTGDRASEANRVAAELSILTVYSQLLPEAKAEHIRNQDEKVLMVGDGINDALALQTATVGVAFGSDLSQAVLGGADVAIQDRDLDLLPQLVTLSQKTERVLQRNIVLSIVAGILMAVLTGIGWLSIVGVALAQLGAAMLVTAQSASILGLFSSEDSVVEEEPSF
jgi:Cd2+/Zn2+-exporting ATPase